MKYLFIIACYIITLVSTAVTSAAKKTPAPVVTLDCWSCAAKAAGTYKICNYGGI